MFLIKFDLFVFVSIFVCLVHGFFGRPDKFANELFEFCKSRSTQNARNLIQRNRNFANSITHSNDQRRRQPHKLRNQPVVEAATVGGGAPETAVRGATTAGLKADKALHTRNRLYTNCSTPDRNGEFCKQKYTYKEMFGRE